MTIPLSDSMLRSFHPRFSFANNNPHPFHQVTCIKFSQDGNKLASICNDRSVHLINCDRGTTDHTMNVGKYGAGICDFMDTNDRILVTSSSNVDHAVRELNFTKGSYQTLYGGHRGLVVSLAVHQKNRVFLTGSEDKSVALWDFRSQKPGSYQTKLPDTPLVAFDPTGNLFYVAMQTSIQMYDLRGLGFGPFNEFIFNNDDVRWARVTVSPKGDQILMSSCSAKIRLIDAIFGRIQRNFEDKSNTQQAIAIGATFSPSSNYILTGSASGSVNIYHNGIKNGYNEQALVGTMRSHQNNPITSVEFNPKYTMFATASSITTLWLPRTE